VPRPKKAVPPVSKNIMLPVDIVARVEIQLYSMAEERVPFGAWQNLLVGLLLEWLREREQIGPANDGPDDPAEGGAVAGEAA
jgi:hypothetical protein